MKTVNEFEVIDHGFYSEQYFQGCDVAYTEFEDVATGIGETAKEAFEDALELLAQRDWNVETIPSKGNGFSRKTVQGYLKSIGISKADREETETYAHVSIRVR